MDEYFMRKALEEAELAYREEEIPIGAIVVYKGEIIGRGHNKVEQDQNPLQHAELIAIKEASEAIGSWRLIDCDLYVTLEPCIMCSGALVYSRIRRVVFGAYDPKKRMLRQYNGDTAGERIQSSCGNKRGGSEGRMSGKNSEIFSGAEGEKTTLIVL